MPVSLRKTVFVHNLTHISSKVPANTDQMSEKTLFDGTSMLVLLCNVVPSTCCSSLYLTVVRNSGQHFPPSSSALAVDAILSSVKQHVWIFPSRCWRSRAHDTTTRSIGPNFCRKYLLNSEQPSNKIFRLIDLRRVLFFKWTSNLCRLKNAYANLPSS